jgi:hypothetical protein
MHTKILVNAMTRIPQFLPIITVCIYLIHLLFGWVNANVDSYFYWAIGEYFKTGNYPFIHPFIYTKPTTISPPLYGLFFIATDHLPRADILLHGIQLAALGLSSIFVYKLLRLHLSKTLSLWIAFFFSVFPVNLVYASYAMTENLSQLVVCAWLYLVAFGIKHKRPLNVSGAVLLGAVGGVLKYNLMILAPIAGLLLVWFFRPWKWTYFVYPTFAVIIICSWILINHTITGVWGLYDTRGTQLYNQFIWQTKLLPPEDHPAVRRMRSLLPPGTNIAVAYWDLQEHLANKLGREWTKIDRVLFDVGWAAVSTHPFEYVFHSLHNFARVHYADNPHWHNLNNIGRKDVSGIDAPFCGVLGSVSACSPVLTTPWSFSIWNTFITYEMRLFRLLAPIVFYVVLLPSLFVTLVSRKHLVRFWSVLYLVTILPIAFTIHPDPRYIVPFYGLGLLVIVAAVQELVPLLGRGYTPQTKSLSDK